MKKIVVGNWKMNGSKQLVDELASLLKLKMLSYQSVICPPFTLIDYSRRILPNFIAIGSQTCSEFENGAYTGDISCSHIKEIGGSYVLLGHSERRLHHHESDENIAQKLQCALNHRLTPIVCFGESKEIYQKGETKNILKKQLVSIAPFLKNHSFYIAYEPLWAIGTGILPTLSEIEDIHQYIYSELGINPLYGGSITLNNYQDIVHLDSVGGILVGGESLKPKRFSKILCNELDE